MNTPDIFTPSKNPYKGGYVIWLDMVRSLGGMGIDLMFRYQEIAMNTLETSKKR